jgi:hypothetical protein
MADLNLSNVLSGLDAYVAAQEAQIRAGLRAGFDVCSRRDVASNRAKAGHRLITVRCRDGNRERLGGGVRDV